MGGEITVESEVGKGSVFSFSLHFDTEDRSLPEPDAGTLELAGKRVLIVDDNATNRRVLCEYVRSWGCVPTSVGSARDALVELRAAGGTGFAVALVDAQMPDVSGFDLARTVTTSPDVRDVPLLVLSSLGPGLARESKAAGAAGYVAKPVKRSELFDAISAALGSRAPSRDPSAGEAPARPGRALRILVAEDNPVNQRVTIHMLRKQGHLVQAVANGREAVEALASEHFDAVLMDVQMPEMDGLEATQAIRQHPRFARLPIIALTAHAMKGDRERCLAAGMDDYLAKPFQPADVAAALEAWTDGNWVAPMPATESGSRVRGEAAPLDLEALEDLFDGDRDFVQSLLEDFLDCAEEQLRELDGALSAGDAEATARTAHSIKGAAANLTAESVRAAALQVEQAGRAGDVDAAKRAANGLGDEVDAFRDWARRCVSSTA
jgi:CheY-like chemotaxis protein/HPt (histidine-containing phosphotransfer) domain-containing protein